MFDVYRPSSSFPQTFVRSHKVGPFTNFSPRTAYNYISGKLKFHDRRTRPPIKEPMLGARILRRSRPGTCVISRLAWYSVGVQHALHERRHASGYERLRLPTVSPRYFSFFLLSRCLRIFSLSLSLSLSLFLPVSLFFNSRIDRSFKCIVGATQSWKRVTSPGTIDRIARSGRYTRHGVLIRRW